MPRLHESILDTIGRTPAVRINRLAPAGVNLYAKLEAFNPLGSVKDRMALAVIEEAERSARRWLSEHGVPGIRLHLAPIDRWQSWTDLESHAAAADFVRVSRRGIFFRPGGRIGSQLGRIYRWPAVRRAELAMSGEPLGRFGFYICLGFRPT